METSPMATDTDVIENPDGAEIESNEIAPVEVNETRAQQPEIENWPVQQVNMLDVTKLSYELQQGYRVFIEMSSDTYKNVTWPFMEPVDAESLGLWDYHDKIKEPMSFQEIGGKFNNYEYNSITEVVADIRLILENCYRYNGSNHWVSKLGHKMEKILEQKLALLNRSLRDKVNLEATMALRSDFASVANPSDGTGRRRAAARNSYVKMINGEESSSLLTRLKIQEDLEERERRRIREKEKKEANLVLLQDLAEWEEKELGTDVLKELQSMWEIPSLAGLLFLLKDFLYIPDLSITELELGFVYANKSSLLARIFTALLITPHQRKSLFKKPPMKFKVWESKLCDRVNSWYKATEKDGQEFTCQQYGLDMTLFEVVGEVNPLLEKSYMDLTLHQRVWILKCLCDNSLVRDYDFRDHLTTTSPADQRELLLGTDANNWTYLYFPIFSATDLRIYKQCPLEVPTFSKRKKKVTTPPPAIVKPKVTPARAATPIPSKRNTRLRKLRSSTPSPEPETPPPPTPPPSEQEDPLEPKNTIAEGFELAACDIETLKKLCEKFDDPPPPPTKRGRKPKPPPPRKRCEVDLHQTLIALLEELEKYEMSFGKMMSKAKIKIMKESQEPEPEDEPEVLPVEEGEEWGSEENSGDEIEDAGAQNMSSDEDFVLEDEEGRRSKTPTRMEATKDSQMTENQGSTGTSIVLPQKRKAADEADFVDECQQPSSSTDGDTDNDPCSISIQTAPLKLKKKRKKSVTTVVSSATVTAVTQATSAGFTQANRQPASHVPAGLQMDKQIGLANVVAAVPAAADKKVFSSSSCVNTVAIDGVATSRPSITLQGTNAPSVRIHPKPVILNKSQSSTVSKKQSLASVSTSHVQSIASVHPVTVSKNLASTASSLASSLQSQAGLSATVPGLGKVMFVTSSGVPLQVLKAVPVSQQSLAQGKVLNTAILGNTGSLTSASAAPSSSSTSSPSEVSVALRVMKALPISQQHLIQTKSVTTAAGGSSTSSPACVVTSSLPLLTPTTSSAVASSLSLPSKSTSGSSQLPSTSIHKVVISAAPAKSCSTLSTAKAAEGLVGTTSASSPVILVQHPGTGGIVPITVKGGTRTMSAPSGSQQLVIIRPSSTTQLSGTAISVLGNAKIAQTAQGQKVVIASAGQSVPQVEAKTSSVISGNKVFVQAAMSPIGMKTSEAKTTAVASGSKLLVTTIATTPSTTTIPQGIDRVPTTYVTSAPTVLQAGQSLPQVETKVSVVSGNKSFVKETVCSSGVTEAKSTVALESTAALPTTMVTASMLPAFSKGPNSIVTMSIGSTASVTCPVESKPTIIASSKSNKQVAPKEISSNEVPTTPVTLESKSAVMLVSPVGAKLACASSHDQQLTSSHVTSPNECALKADSLCLNTTEASNTIPRTEISQCDGVKVVQSQTKPALLPQTDLKKTDAKSEDSFLPAKSMPLGLNGETKELADSCTDIKGTVGLKAKDSKNDCELLLDLTCYETSGSESGGCEESGDSSSSGLYPNSNTTLPSKLIETDVKQCNGVSSPLSQEVKHEEKELDCQDQNLDTVVDKTSEGILSKSE